MFLFLFFIAFLSKLFHKFSLELPYFIDKLLTYDLNLIVSKTVIRDSYKNFGEIFDKIMKKLIRIVFDFQVYFVQRKCLAIYILKIHHSPSWNRTKVEKRCNLWLFIKLSYKMFHAVYFFQIVYPYVPIFNFQCFAIWLAVTVFHLHFYVVS